MFPPSSDFPKALQKVNHDTSIKYEPINSKPAKKKRKRRGGEEKEEKDTYLNYESINSKPAREEQGDKKLQEGAKEIAEAIRRR